MTILELAADLAEAAYLKIVANPKTQYLFTQDEADAIKLLIRNARHLVSISDALQPRNTSPT